MSARNAHERRLATIFAASILVIAPRAQAQQAGRPMVFPEQPTVALLALDGDVGGAQAWNGDGRTWFGRVGTGLSLWNGERLFDVTAEIAGFRDERITAGIGTRYLSGRTGLGASATLMRDLSHDAWGAGAGFSFSVINLQAQIFVTEPRASRLVLFVRVPFGLLFHELLRIRARGQNPTPPTPAAAAQGRRSFVASGPPIDWPQ